LPARVGRPPTLHLPAAPLPAEPISRATFARLLGVGKARVTGWTRDGVVRPPAVTADGSIIPALAVEQMQAAGCFASAEAPLARLNGTEPPEAGAMTYDAARTASETLKAHRALLDLRERRGELVETVTAEDVLFAATRAFRDGLTTWPVRVAAEMAARLGVPPAALLAELEGGIRVFLAALADPAADWRQDRR
jgi:hypothetical protein